MFIMDADEFTRLNVLSEKLLDKITTPKELIEFYLMIFLFRMN